MQLSDGQIRTVFESIGRQNISKVEKLVDATARFSKSWSIAMMFAGAALETLEKDIIGGAADPNTLWGQFYRLALQAAAKPESVTVEQIEDLSSEITDANQGALDLWDKHPTLFGGDQVPLVTKFFELVTVNVIQVHKKRLLKL